MSDDRDTARQVYRQLATGRVNDVVKLTQGCKDIDSLDLMCVSELRVTGGAIQVKIADRLRAAAALAACSDDDALGMLQALNTAARQCDVQGSDPG